MRSGGNGSSRRRPRREGRERTDLDQAGAAGQRPARAAGDRPGRVARVARAGWASCRPEALGARQEAGQEPMRQLDVVVDHDHPGGVAGAARLEQGVQVLELARAPKALEDRLARAARARARRAPRARPHGGRRAPHLRDRARHRAAWSARIDPRQHETARRRRRGRAQPRGQAGATPPPRRRGRAAARAVRAAGPSTIPLWPESTSSGSNGPAHQLTGPRSGDTRPRSVRSAGSRSAPVAEDVEHTAGQHAQLAQDAGASPRCST